MNKAPATQAAIANEPKSQPKRSSRLAGTSTKFQAEAMAYWNWATAMTTDFIRFGALVKAYSREVMEAKISPMPTRIYGPDMTQTLIGAASG